VKHFITTIIILQKHIWFQQGTGQTKHKGRQKDTPMKERMFRWKFRYIIHVDINKGNHIILNIFTLVYAVDARRCRLIMIRSVIKPVFKQNERKVQEVKTIVLNIDILKSYCYQNMIYVISDKLN
jgi:hypothetical protein